MSSDWILAMDSLASGGVIDFDAPAYLLDQPARYVGHPPLEKLPNEISLLPEGTKMKEQPKQDGFHHPDEGMVQTPAWKKWTFGALLTTIVGGTIGAILFKKGKIKLPKNIKMPDMTKLKNTMKNFAQTTWTYIKKPFVWIGSKFKKKP